MRLPRRHGLIVASLIVISCVATLIVIADGRALIDPARYGESGALSVGGDLPHVPVVVVPVPTSVSPPGPVDRARAAVRAPTADRARAAS